MYRVGYNYIKHDMFYNEFNNLVLQLLQKTHFFLWLRFVTKKFSFEISKFKMFLYIHREYKRH